MLTACGEFEGYSQVPYSDPVGYSTVCHGHKVKYGEKQSYNWQECEAFRIADAAKAFILSNQCTKALSLGQAVAFADLAYNVGSDAFCKSSVARMSRKGLYLEPCRELKRYVYAGGRKLSGLVYRRSYFYEVCVNPRWPV